MSISIRYNSKVLPRFYYLIQSACKRKTKKLRWFFLFHVWRHSIKYSMYVNSILKKITKISSGSITLITLYFKGTRSFRFFLQQDFRQHFKKSCMTVYTYFFSIKTLFWQIAYIQNEYMRIDRKAIKIDHALLYIVCKYIFMYKCKYAIALLLCFP